MNKDKRIVFMGTPAFAVESLKALVQNNYNVIAVFTQPDRPKGRGGKVQKSEVKIFAEANNIPVYQPLKTRQDGLEILKDLKPDFFVTAAFGQILSQEVLDVPRATINVHGSLLPKHRGASPAQWAILNGDAVTGVTTMLTDKGIDTGDMLLKAECVIEDTDTAETLLHKLSIIGADLLIKTLENFDNISPQKQDDSQSSYDPMLNKEMGIIDFNNSAIQISRQVRALQPWPKAFIVTDKGNINILEVKVIESNSGQVNGTILKANNKEGIIVSTGDGSLEIITLQAPNKKAMSAKAYMLGNKVIEGERAEKAFL
ncbi:MAG: methionyl-tRNA formyltransferase [Christensenellaceae bacterium]|nr:methionyl-tRNA formyltransferase [Christensenellaceae bacterium]